MNFFSLFCGMSKICQNEDTAGLEKVFPFEVYARLPDIADSGRQWVHNSLLLLLDGVIFCFFMQKPLSVYYFSFLLISKAAFPISKISGSDYVQLSTAYAMYTSCETF